MSTAVSENKQFKKYNHALIPSVPPHLLEIPSKQDIRHLVWKSKVLFARYTSDFQLITPPRLQYRKFCCPAGYNV